MESSRKPVNSKLIDEYPYLLLPTLAVELGVNQAVFLQQLNFLLAHDQRVKEAKGQFWIRKTMEDWERVFPFWSQRTIRRIIDSLKNKGLIENTDKLNAHISDRTLWYTVYEDNLTSLSRSASPPLESDSLSPPRAGQAGRQVISKNSKINKISSFEKKKLREEELRSFTSDLTKEHPSLDSNEIYDSAVDWCEDHDTPLTKSVLRKFVKTELNNLQKQYEEGYDSEGYDSQGYNKFGTDRNGCLRGQKII